MLYPLMPPLRINYLTSTRYEQVRYKNFIRGTGNLKCQLQHVKLPSPIHVLVYIFKLFNKLSKCFSLY